MYPVYFLPLEKASALFSHEKQLLCCPVEKAVGLLPLEKAFVLLSNEKVVSAVVP